MVIKHKKIYLFICGQLPETRQKNWLSAIPEVSIMADLDTVVVFDKPSADITPEVWLRLAREIHSRFGKAQGFVILHSLDNILYTANAMNFLLQNLTRPIVFTGSQFNVRRRDMRANLINAIQTASSDFSEVCLMFGNRLLRASQAGKAGAEMPNLFAAPDTAVLGRVDFSIRLFEKNLIRNKGKVKFFDKLNDNFLLLGLSPFLNLPLLTRQLTEKDGVLLWAKNYEVLPYDLLFLFQKLIKDKPVVVWSKKIPASSPAPENVLIINDMTWEATALKFSWALTQTKDPREIRKLMAKDIADEMFQVSSSMF